MTSTLPSTILLSDQCSEILALSERVAPLLGADPVAQQFVEAARNLSTMLRDPTRKKYRCSVDCAVDTTVVLRLLDLAAEVAQRLINSGDPRKLMEAKRMTWSVINIMDLYNRLPYNESAHRLFKLEAYGEPENSLPEKTTGGYW